MLYSLGVFSMYLTTMCHFFQGHNYTNTLTHMSSNLEDLPEVMDERVSERVSEWGRERNPR